MGAGPRPSTVTNKFRDMVGRVTPCAPFGKLCAGCGAHGVTRPTRALRDVTKLLCRGTSDVTRQPFHGLPARGASSQYHRSAELHSAVSTLRSTATEDGSRIFNPLR